MRLGCLLPGQAIGNLRVTLGSDTRGNLVFHQDRDEPCGGLADCKCQTLVDQLSPYVLGLIAPPPPPEWRDSYISLSKWNFLPFVNADLPINNGSSTADDKHCLEYIGMIEVSLQDAAIHNQTEGKEQTSPVLPSKRHRHDGCSCLGRILSLSTMMAATTDRKSFFVHLKTRQAPLSGSKSVSGIILVFQGDAAVQWRPFLRAGAFIHFNQVKRITVNINNRKSKIPFYQLVLPATHPAAPSTTAARTNDRSDPWSADSRQQAVYSISQPSDADHELWDSEIDNDVRVNLRGMVTSIDIEHARIELDNKVDIFFFYEGSFGGLPSETLLFSLRVGALISIYAAYICALGDRPDALFALVDTSIIIEKPAPGPGPSFNENTLRSKVQQLEDHLRKLKKSRSVISLSPAGMLLARDFYSKLSVSLVHLFKIFPHVGPRHPNQVKSQNSSSNSTAVQREVVSTSFLEIQSLEALTLDVLERIAKAESLDLAWDALDPYARFVSLCEERPSLNLFFQPRGPRLISLVALVETVQARLPPSPSATDLEASKSEVRVISSNALFYESDQHVDPAAIAELQPSQPWQLGKRSISRPVYLVGQIQAHHSSGALRFCDSTGGINLMIYGDKCPGCCGSGDSWIPCVPSHGIETLSLVFIRNFSVIISLAKPKAQLGLVANMDDIIQSPFADFLESSMNSSKKSGVSSDHVLAKPAVLFLVASVSSPLSNVFKIQAYAMGARSSDSELWSSISPRSERCPEFELRLNIMDEYPALCPGCLIVITSDSLKPFIRAVVVPFKQGRLPESNPRDETNAASSMLFRVSLAKEEAQVHYISVSQLRFLESGSSPSHLPSVIRENRLLFTNKQSTEECMRQIEERRSQVLASMNQSLSQVLRVQTTSRDSVLDYETVSFLALVDKQEWNAAQNEWILYVIDPSNSYDKARIVIPEQVSPACSLPVGLTFLFSKVDRKVVFHGSAAEPGSKAVLVFYFMAESQMYATCSSMRLRYSIRMAKHGVLGNLGQMKDHGEVVNASSKEPRGVPNTVRIQPVLLYSLYDDLSRGILHFHSLDIEVDVHSVQELVAYRGFAQCDDWKMKLMADDGTSQIEVHLKGRALIYDFLNLPLADRDVLTATLVKLTSAEMKLGKESLSFAFKEGDPDDDKALKAMRKQLGLIRNTESVLAEPGMGVADPFWLPAFESSPLVSRPLCTTLPSVEERLTRHFARMIHVHAYRRVRLLGHVEYSSEVAQSVGSDAAPLRFITRKLL